MSQELQSIQEEIINQAELDRVNEIVDFITQTDSLPTENEILNFILQEFTDNSIKILKSDGTPLNILLKIIARLGQINAGLIKKEVSKMLYTQTNGDFLSMCAANYGYTRIEAKQSSMVLILTANKDLTIEKDTNFVDGNNTIWITKDSVNLKKDMPTRVNALSQNTGQINYISPINPQNTIAGLSSVEVDANSIVIGREQESDTELKETIKNGIPIQGADMTCRRELLKLRMVNSAFVYTNPFEDKKQMLGIDVDSRQRYVALRVSNENLSQEEADLISLAISDNTIYNANYQMPKDKKVKLFFGIEEDKLTLPKEEGGAGLAGIDENSNAVLVRQTKSYGNFIDIYFYIAKPTDIDIRLGIRYKGNYTNSEKENMTGNIKQLVSQAVAQIAQVGSSLLISEITERVLNKTDLSDKITIRNATLNLHSSSQITQALDAKGFEYFRIYDIPSKPYAGVIITEV